MKTIFCYRRESVERILSTRPKLNVDDLFDEDLQKARYRAERAITEDAFFDSRGARIPKSSINKSALAVDEDIDEEVSWEFLPSDVTMSNCGRWVLKIGKNEIQIFPRFKHH